MTTTRATSSFYAIIFIAASAFDFDLHIFCKSPQFVSGTSIPFPSTRTSLKEHAKSILVRDSYPNVANELPQRKRLFLSGACGVDSIKKYRGNRVGEAVSEDEHQVGTEKLKLRVSRLFDSHHRVRRH
jgi:hypothetical protein